MSKRMKLAAMVLTGSIIMTGSGQIFADTAAKENTLGPSAGISGILVDYLKQENDKVSSSNERLRLVEGRGDAAGRQEEQQAFVEEHEVPEVASEYADIAIAQVNNYVNLRAEPNTESEVLGKLYNKSAAIVHEVTEDGWYRITSGTVEGYVKAEYVVVGDEELARSVGTRYAKVTTTTLFVRTEPSTDAKILTMLPEGDDFVVVDESIEGWAKVTTEEGDGYVSLDYVTLSTEYVKAESKAEEEQRLAKEEAERKAAAEAAEAARRAKEAEAAANAARARSASRPSSSGNQQGSSSGKAPGASVESQKPSGSVSNGQAVVNYARQFLGNPYVYGGTSLTSGADCSGFIMSVYAAFGVSLPHSSASLRSVGYEVGPDHIQPGDIVCYSGHVGIYAGNNTLIHASSPKTGIKLTSPITYRPVLTIRRIF